MLLTFRSKGYYKIPKVIFFLFSETMLDKFVKEDRMNALAELQLYIMVLEMVDKPEQALWVLKGPLVGI